MIHQIIIKKNIKAVDSIKQWGRLQKYALGWKTKAWIGFIILIRIQGLWSSEGFVFTFFCSVCKLASAPPIKSRGKRPSSIKLFTPLSPGDAGTPGPKLPPHTERWRRDGKSRAPQAIGEQFCACWLVGGSDYKQTSGTDVVSSTAWRSRSVVWIAETWMNGGSMFENKGLSLCPAPLTIYILAEALPWLTLQDSPLSFSLSTDWKPSPPHPERSPVPLFSPSTVHLCTPMFALQKEPMSSSLSFSFLHTFIQSHAGRNTNALVLESPALL